MMKNITFTAEESTLQTARAQALRERRTLNEAFRDWLTRYSGRHEASIALSKLWDRYDYVESGGPFSRHELNSRS